ncbi:hypothetical protein GQ457_05G018310 [Hibiscus cannabinus]
MGLVPENSTNLPNLVVECFIRLWLILVCAQPFSPPYSSFQSSHHSPSPDLVPTCSGCRQRCPWRAQTSSVYSPFLSDQNPALPSPNRAAVREIYPETLSASLVSVRTTVAHFASVVFEVLGECLGCVGCDSVILC